LRVLFIHKGYESIGIQCLSAYAKSLGHQVDLIFDCSPFSSNMGLNNLALDRLFGISEQKLESRIAEQIQTHSPDIIGFSLMTVHYQWALRVARKIKERFSIPIVFGGVHITAVPEVALEEDCVDAAVVGEGYGALKDLLESIENGKFTRHDIKNVWFRTKDGIVKNPLRPLEDIDKMPLPDKDLFNNKLDIFYKRYILNTSSLCPYRCAYCFNRVCLDLYGVKSPVQKRSIDNIIEELQNARSAHQIDVVQFFDDIFTLDKEWLEQFLPRYRKEINLPYTCYAHFNCIDEDRIKLLKETGCRNAQFGLQSWNEQYRNEVIRRHYSNKRIYETAELCKKHGLNFSTDYILEWPWDNEPEMKDAARHFINIKPNAVSCFLLSYFPGIEITSYALEKGCITEERIEAIKHGFQGSADELSDNPLFSKYQIFFEQVPSMPRWLAFWILEHDLIKYIPHSVFLRQAMLILTELIRNRARLDYFLKYIIRYLLSRSKLP